MDSYKKADEVYKQILEEIFTEIVFQVEIEQQFELSIQNQLRKYIKEEKVPINSLDIFNNSNSKETNECTCPNCKRTLGALRFAPHLEKCVGMGRSSSRIANRRILASSNSGKEVKYTEDLIESNGIFQSQNNVEWIPPKTTRRMDARKKKDRINKHYKSKRKIDDLSAGGIDVSDDFKYCNMNYEQKQHILAHMCGVVSEHTGRLCTRSVRCPKHSDEQRNNVRLSILSNNDIHSDFSKMTVQESKNIEDIEMIEVEQSNLSSPNKKFEKQYRLKNI
ncbi:hypothetical protein PGB90_005317 [Kerria lacca]